MSNRDAHQLIERYLIAKLNSIFEARKKVKIPAILVVFDPTMGITGRFRSSGYTDSFKQLFPKQLTNLRDSGMEVDERGLLSRAADRFDAEPDSIWAYGVELHQDKFKQHKVWEAKLTSRTYSKKWNPIQKDEVTLGRQLNEFIEDIHKVSATRKSIGKYLIIIPYSASGTFQGLVLLVWIADQLPPDDLPEALKFLRAEGVLLSAHQNSLVTDAATARADGYRRFASLVRHEENGFVQTLEGLIRRLANAESTWKRLRISRDEIEFLKTTMNSKKDLNQELSDEDPLHRLNPDLLYTEPSFIRAELPGIIKYIQMELTGHYFNIAPLTFGKGIRDNTKIDIKLLVIERIIRNAVKNSAKIAIQNENNEIRKYSGYLPTTLPPVEIRIFADVKSFDGRRFFELVIDDNAGGLLDKDMPRDITPEIWTRYRADNNFGPDQGNGFWIISRYAISSGGKFRIEEIQNEKVPIGVRYTVRLGLRN
jgi:hypothetical protein